jgi:SAM-dependent methyltransferase
LDIGGGLSGFQFVLSKKGCRVVNVDPGMDAKGKGWPCTPKSMAQLNQIFNTDVVLYNTTVDNANIPANSLDAAVSISVIEHLPRTEVISVMNCVWDFLKPGGIFVLTVDLFLNIYPFCAEKTNKYGSNINLAELAGVKPFKIVLGDTRELFGFPDFDANSILNQKDKYLIGRGYPAMVQCLVLEKPIR